MLTFLVGAAMMVSVLVLFRLGGVGAFLCLMSCGGSAPGFGGLGSLGSSFGI